LQKTDQNSELMMSGTFADIVDEVQKLSVEEKEELRLLLDKYLIEDRRAEIRENYLTTRKEEKEGKLKTPRNMDEFREMLRK